MTHDSSKKSTKTGILKVIFCVTLSFMLAVSLFVTTVSAYTETPDVDNNTDTYTRIARAPFYFSAYTTNGSVAVFDSPTYRTADDTPVFLADNSPTFPATTTSTTCTYYPNLTQLNADIHTIQARLPEVVCVPLSQAQSALERAFNMTWSLPVGYIAEDLNVRITGKYLVYDANERATPDIVPVDIAFRYDGTAGLSYELSPVAIIADSVRDYFNTSATMYIDDVNILVSFSSTASQYRCPVLSYSMSNWNVSAGVRPIGLEELTRLDGFFVGPEIGDFKPVGSFLLSVADSFFSFQIAPNVTFYEVLYLITGLSLLMLFIKFVAGG